MNMYSVITRDYKWIVYAPTVKEAEMLVIDDEYRHVLDDDLPDLEIETHRLAIAPKETVAHIFNKATNWENDYDEHWDNKLSEELWKNIQQHNKICYTLWN